MREANDAILQRLGKALRTANEGMVEGWIELIKRLEETNQRGRMADGAAASAH
jgi:hypothetical protein